jgi:hypothetical protein
LAGRGDLGDELLARCDDSKTRNEFGLEPRPLGETFADTIRWLVDVGHLTPGEAGRLAGVPT